MPVKTFAVENKSLKKKARAVRVSEANFVNVSLWCPTGSETAWTEGKGGVIVDERVRVKTKKGLRVARIKDVVIKLDEDDFIVVKEGDFGSEWEKDF